MAYPSDRNNVISNHIAGAFACEHQARSAPWHRPRRLCIHRRGLSPAARGDAEPRHDGGRAPRTTARLWL
jgi:hypothetical protein